MNNSPENEIRAALITAERLLDRARCLSGYVKLKDRRHFVDKCYMAASDLAQAYSLLCGEWKE